MPFGGDGPKHKFTKVEATTKSREETMTRKLTQLSTILASVLLLCASTAFSATSISNVVTTPTSPASLIFNEYVYIDFDYETDEAGGVRIWARPFTDGSKTPNCTGHGSIVHPTGSGSITGNFKITSGETVVDSIRFQMTNADQSDTLLEYFVPVEFQYSTHAIKNVVCTPTSPACLLFDEYVNIDFDYETDEAGGVRIFARPFTNGSKTPNCTGHGSIVHPVGSGSLTGNFKITSGDATIDSIRFQMLNADQSDTLLEYFVPVEFQYSTHAIQNIVLTPTSPDTLDFNEHVDITYDYETDEAGGVRIWTWPFTNGARTTNYAISASPLHPTGSGSEDSYFTVTSGEAIVDSVQFQMWTDGSTALLLEYFLPVHYGFDSGTPADPVGNEPTRPESFTLKQNHPNPFNPSTVIEYAMHKKSHVTITVFNSLGQKVKTLIDEPMDVGPHTAYWEGVDSDGKPVSTGVYFYKFESDDGSETKKMILVK
jgi:hypothetical protein